MVLGLGFAVYGLGLGLQVYDLVVRGLRSESCSLILGLYFRGLRRMEVQGFQGCMLRVFVLYSVRLYDF